MWLWQGVTCLCEADHHAALSLKTKPPKAAAQARPKFRELEAQSGLLTGDCKPAIGTGDGEGGVV